MNRSMPRLLLAVSLLFSPLGLQGALAAPFDTSTAYRSMQNHQSKNDLPYKTQAIEAYFLRKNPGVSKTNAAQYARLVEKWSSHYALDPFLVASILVKESTVKVQAVSKGNYGLMQINWKANGPWIVKTFPIRSTKELMEPSNNIRMGAISSRRTYGRARVTWIGGSTGTGGALWPATGTRCTTTTRRSRNSSGSSAPPPDPETGP